MLCAYRNGSWVLSYCQSRTGEHNMYKEFRDVTLNGAVDQMYAEMASRHRSRASQIQIVKTATVPSNQCKRVAVTMMHVSLTGTLVHIANCLGLVFC